MGCDGRYTERPGLSAMTRPCAFSPTDEVALADVHINCAFS